MPTTQEKNVNGFVNTLTIASPSKFQLVSVSGEMPEIAIIVDTIPNQTTGLLNLFKISFIVSPTFLTVVIVT